MDFHPLFLIVLVAIVLILFGPGRLPEIGGAIGRGVREFRQASDSKDELGGEEDHPDSSPT